MPSAGSTGSRAPLQIQCVTALDMIAGRHTFTLDLSCAKLQRNWKSRFLKEFARGIAMAISYASNYDKLPASKLPYCLADPKLDQRN